MNRFGIGVALVFGLAAVSSAQQTDSIFGSKGTPTRGTITGMDPNVVKIRTGTGETSIPVGEIRRLTFAEDPPELGRAREHVFNQRYEDARAELGKISTAPARSEVAIDLLYYRAYVDGKLALAGAQGSDRKKAKTALIDFASKAKTTTYHFFDLCQIIGDLGMATQEFAEAQKYYNAIKGQAATPEMKLKGSVLSASALLAAEKYPEAQAAFIEIVKEPASGVEADRQKMFARVGAVVCMAEGGQAAQGIKAIDKIITDYDPQNEPALFGRAYNALGRCHMKSGNQLDAILAFLHTDLMFYSEPEVHAESLYFLNKLWMELKKPDRAVAAKSLLSQRYGGSLWAQKQ